MVNDVSIYQKNSRDLIIAVKNADGTPASILDCSFLFKVNDQTHGVNLITKSSEDEEEIEVDVVNSKIKVILKDTDTDIQPSNEYVYAVEITTVALDSYNIIQGRLIILDNYIL